MKIKEIDWIKSAKGYKYYIAEDGTVFYETKGIRKTKKSKLFKGYMYTWISGSPKLVHRLVAKAFIPNPDNKPNVSFVNGIRTDLHADNLIWHTGKETSDRAYSLGLMTFKKPDPDLHYLATEDGRIVTSYGKEISQRINATGYMFVKIAHKTHFVHRLVAKQFIPNPRNKRTVNHKDGDKANNSVGNLEWATQKENMIHAVQTGLLKKKLSQEDVMEIFSLRGSRRRVASRFGVDVSTISSIWNGHTWGHLTGQKKTNGYVRLRRVNKKDFSQNIENS